MGVSAPTLRSRLTRTLLATCFCVVALSTGLTIWFARSAAEDQAKNELTNRIAALDDRVEYELALRDEQGLNTGAATALCRRGPWADAPGGNFTVARLVGSGLTPLAAGPVGSARCPQPPPGLTLDKLGLTPQEAQSLTNTHFSIVGNMLWGVAPLEVNSSAAGGVGAAASFDGLVWLVGADLGGARLGGLLPGLITTMLTASLLAVAVSLWLARKLSAPIKRIERNAQRLAAGDLSARAGPQPGADADISALATTIDAMASDLEASRQAERQFLMSVSHDLRTPLASIRGYAETLSDPELDGTAIKDQAAQVISTQAIRLERLVDDLLALARLETQSFGLRSEDVDVAAIATETVAAFVPEALDAGVGVGVETSGPIWAVADPSRVAQMLSNLLENAISFASHQVEVSVLVNDGFAVIAVTDDGPGIPEDQLANVFTRLYSARDAQPEDRSSRKLGTGLGLAIVAELAIASGGRAEALASPAGGATLRVLLPAAPASA